MSRGPHSFEVKIGEDVSIPIAITDSNDAAVNLTGASARFVAFNRKTGAIVLDSDGSPTTATITITTPSNGIVTVGLADTDTDNLLETTYGWELKVTDSGGNEAVASFGYVDFLQSVTSG